MLQFVLDGFLDSRIAEFLRGPGWDLSKYQAKTLIAKAHRAIAKQGPRPPEWHRCNALRICGASLANANFRVALEAHKDMGRIDGIHEGAIVDIELDGTPESVTRMMQAAIMAAINGKISNNKLQAIQSASHELLRQMSLGEEEGEDLEAIDVTELGIRDATSRILALGKVRGNKSSPSADE